jgi:hypothetical protein
MGLIACYYSNVAVDALNLQLDEVIRLKHADAADVLDRALREGMRHLYLDAVLEARLRGGLTREEAVERVGEADVARAEEEWQAVREDVTWGLNGRT